MPYQDWMTPTDQESQFIPWLMKQLAGGGDPNLYKQQVAPQVAPTAPRVAAASPMAAPAMRRDAEAVDAVALPPMAQAMNVPAAPAAGMPYEGPDAPFDLSAPPIAQAMGQQPGILQQIIGNPYATQLMSQMGAGLLRGKDLKEGLANAFDASSAVAQRAQAVKRTPIANGTAILEEYADGTSKVVPVTSARPKAPTGYQWSADGKLEVIPGGPKDLAAVQLSKTLENNFTRLTTKNENVIGAIDKALGQVGSLSAGPIGQATSWVGGTPGANLEATLDEIQANIGFAELEDMRKSSPTGGALGQVAVKELEFLQAVKGSLKQKQSPAQLKANLERVKQEFMASRQRLQDAYEADIAAGLIQRGSRPSLEGGAKAAAPASSGGSVADRASGYLR